MSERAPYDGLGQAGPRDIEEGWRYDLADVSAEIVPVIRAAVGDIGRREDPPGSNKGPEIEKYHNPNGRPWCALALSYWWGRRDGGCPWGVLASAYKIHRWAKANGRLLPIDPVVRPGDVAIRLYGHKGHVGLVVHVLPSGHLCTVEGNAGDRVRGRVSRPDEWRYLVRPLPICA